MTLAKYKKIIFIIILIIVTTIIIYKFTRSQDKFGDIIGTFDGVNSYSNQRGETNSSELNYYNGICTGVKWQCVEFARRYLIIKEGITFSNVESAFEIPRAQFKTLNGVLVQMSNELKIGSLIVWPKGNEKGNEKGLPDGHVAIVRFVAPFGILVVDQNYKNDEFCRFIKNKDLKNVTILGSPN